MSRTLKAHLLLVLVAMIWGCTFPLIKAALADSSPLLLNAVRMSLAAALLAIYYRKSLRSLTRRAFFAGATVGLFLRPGLRVADGGPQAHDAFKIGVPYRRVHGHGAAGAGRILASQDSSLARGGNSPGAHRAFPDDGSGRAPGPG